MQRLGTSKGRFRISVLGGDIVWGGTLSFGLCPEGGQDFLGLRKAGTKYHFRPLRGGWIFVSLSMTIIIPESAQNTFFMRYVVEISEQ